MPHKRSAPHATPSHAVRHTPHATRHAPHATRHTPHNTRHSPPHYRTIQAIVFSKLPAVDASLLISTEPLWAAAVAVVLLGDQLGSANYLGGALIISALLVNQGVVGKFGEEQG
jgi:hypothetical protein